jgi:hypothetical protein
MRINLNPIKNKILYLSLVLLFFNQTILPQQRNFLRSSLYSSLDARTIILGESTVAGLNAPQSFKINPASVSYVQSITFTAGFINNKYFSDLYNVGIQVPTKFGGLGLNFSKFSGLSYFRGPHQGESEDNTFTFNYGNSLTERLSYGLNINYFQSSIPDDIEEMGFKTSQFTFDAGFLYEFTDVTKLRDIKDRIIFGASIQGIGEKIKYYENEYSLPEYLRIGFNYRISFLHADQSEFLGLALHGLYRNYLNPDIYEYSERDFWAMGLDLTLNGTLKLLLGGNIHPYNSLYDEKGNFTLSYGIGADIRIHSFSISVSAGVIPSAFYTDTAAFGLNIRY